MDEQQKAKLAQVQKLRRGAVIIEQTQDQFRQDGYTNLLNKYGTMQDNSMAYSYEQEPVTTDLELIRLYEGNGLFTKIIDRPSEEAVKHGLDIDYGDEDIAEYVDYRLDELEFEDKFATAEKWARLYGGSIIVMLCDDGGGLEEPLDWNKVTSIEEMRVFERAIVQEDYTSLYHFHFFDSMKNKKPFGQPEYYHVYSTYGYFTVHYSRCLIFRNGRLPEHTTNSIYRYWGMPEYVKINRALRECITSHEYGVKLLERSVQAIYKMKNLAQLLSTDAGEDKVLQRLQVIDMARGILNSIAIDTDGEDYDFKSLPMSGVKDVIDATCNMLSAVTNIPQTILFGRSPAGMNATGESDLENYYNIVENIQKQNMKANARTVIDLILKQGLIEGMIPEIPKYKMKFAALWSMSEIEKADVSQKNAQTEQVKAQTAQVYIDSGVLDPSEVRKSLANEGEFDIEEVISEDDLMLPEDTFSPTEMSGTSNNDGGPGSGNFGHEGRPGKVGGAASEGSGEGAGSSGSSGEKKDYSIASYSGTPKEQMQKALIGLGHKQEDIDEMRKLFRAHSGGNSDVQKKADDEIMQHIRDRDSIGKLLEDKSRIEECAWKEQQDAKKRSLEKDYERELFFAEESLKPGGIYENYSKKELQDMNYWPVKGEYVEPRLVRVGSMDRDLLPFSSNPDGAGSYQLEYADPGNIHELSLSALAKMGYRPIAGIATFDVGQSDDYEVLLAKFPTNKKDEMDLQAAAVLVIHNGKILCGSRRSSEGICGPGGHIEKGETPEEAALREAHEEFNIVPLNIQPLGVYKGSTGSYCDTMVYFTDQFTGKPKADGVEMLNERWLSLEDLKGKFLFPPFEESVKMLTNLLTSGDGYYNVTSEDGGPGSGRYPKGSGNSSFSDGSYAKALKGIKTSDGNVVKSIRKHAFDRAKERNIYPSSIKAALENAKPKPGNKPNRSVYEHNGTRAVYDYQKQQLVTVIYVGKGKQK